MADVEVSSVHGGSDKVSVAVVDCPGSWSEDPEDWTSEPVVLAVLVPVPAPLVELVGPAVAGGLPVEILLAGALSTRRAVSPYGLPPYRFGPMEDFYMTKSVRLYLFRGREQPFVGVHVGRSTNPVAVVTITIPIKTNISHSDTGLIEGGPRRVRHPSIARINAVFKAIGIDSNEVLKA